MPADRIDSGAFERPWVSPVEQLKAALRRTPLRPLMRLARQVATTLTNIRGERVLLEGHTFRYLVGSAPPEREPLRTDWVRHADYHMSRAFMRAIRPRAVVADVGAFQGTYTVMAAKLVGEEGRVYAFEPAPLSRPGLVRNVALNGLQGRVEVCPYAVADHPGEVSFYMAGAINENSLYRSGIPDFHSSRVRVTTVEAVALDAFFSNARRYPDVVKVDTEGAEFAVLRGAEEIVRSNAVIICELHPYAWAAAGHDQRDLTHWLAERRRALVDLRTGRRVNGAIHYGPYALERTVLAGGGAG